MVHFPATPVNFVLDLSQEGEMMQWGLKCHRILHHSSCCRRRRRRSSRRRRRVVEEEQEMKKVAQNWKLPQSGHKQGQNKP